MELISRADARAQGLKRYFLGQDKPCKHGHVAERWVVDAWCVTCKIEQLRRRRQDPEFRAKAIEYQRKWRQDPEVRAKRNKRDRQQDPEFRAKRNERDRQRRQDPEVRAKAIEYQRKWRQDPEVRAKEAEYRRHRRQDPEVRAKALEYQRQQYLKNINFRLPLILRQRIRGALKHNWKSGHSLELLGCSVEFLRHHLECQFRENMSWDNMGAIWEIDHSMPCSAFDLTIPAEQRECFNYMNLVPLFVEENRSKSTTPETDEDFNARIERLFAIQQGDLKHEQA